MMVGTYVMDASISTDRTLTLDLTRIMRSSSSMWELRGTIRKLRECHLRSSYHPGTAWRGHVSGRPVLLPMVDADGVWCVACVANERKMLVREVRELAGSNDDAEILFAEDAPLHVLEQWIIESTEVNGHLTITLDMSVLSSDSIVEKAREDGSGDDNPMLPDRVATHSNYPHGGEWLDEVIESNLSLNVAGEYSLPKYDDELEIEAWRFQMSRWRSECADRRRRGMWGQEEWGPSRRLRLSEVSEIRGAMPFGPLSLDECETFAIRFESHPRTILRIAKGRIYAKPAACPPDHPFRWSLAEYGVPKRWSLAEIMGVGVPKKEADDKRRAAQKYRNEIGEAQDWKCKYCGADVSGKGKSALDHIMPIMFGGTSERSNLQILCRRCNGEKSATQPSAELDVRMTRMVDGESMVKTMMQEMSGTSSCNEMAMILSLHGADLRNLLGPSSYRKISRSVAT